MTPLFSAPPQVKNMDPEFVFWFVLLLHDVIIAAYIADQY